MMPLITVTDQIPDPTGLGPVHFIAIGGSGMNGVAAGFVSLGVQVSGSDRQDSDYLQSLRRMGARVYVGHAADQLGDAQTIVINSAIRDDNPELVEARRRGLQVLHRSVALAALMIGHRTIAVAGTHGKTTTTAMIAHLLTELGADPSYVIGGVLQHAEPGQRLKTGGRLGTGAEFVVEADESDGSYLQYPRNIAVVTNIDPDHLVNWGTPERYREGFAAFAEDAQVELLVISADDPGAAALTQRIRDRRKISSAPQRIVTFGRSFAADVVIGAESSTATGPRFSLTDNAAEAGPDPAAVRLLVPGDYNMANAAATYAVGVGLGYPPGAVRSALSSFPGTYRRFQLVGTAGDVEVFDDYAHHPTEVANTVRTARTVVDRSDRGRLVVCMQPHLYSRTRDFWPEFGTALRLADEAVVMDVCGDREDPIPGITGALVAGAIPGERARVTYQPDWDATARTVADRSAPGDLVITLGCGDVTKVAPLIVAELARREQPSQAGVGGAHG
jgi:UDP-N-acetylmuramate--alanine ligase